MKILIVNGPNLNLLGKREPEIYGTDSFETFLTDLRARFPDMDLTYFQSNVEGEIINVLQQAEGVYNGIVLNAGAYTHTSVAIGDTIKAIDVPVIEVHISHIARRESFRQISHISAHCIGNVSGFGLGSYILGLEALRDSSENRFFPHKK